jgi:hypothetical protein
MSRDITEVHLMGQLWNLDTWQPSAAASFAAARASGPNDQDTP